MLRTLYDAPNSWLGNLTREGVDCVKNDLDRRTDAPWVLERRREAVEVEAVETVEGAAKRGRTDVDLESDTCGLTGDDCE